MPFWTARHQRGHASILFALSAQILFQSTFGVRVRHSQSDAAEARNAELTRNTENAELARDAETLLMASPDKTPANEDCMLCKRQNLFDLAMPLKMDSVVRLAAGWGGTNDNDIYVQADSVYIESCKVRIEVYRSGERSFVFEVIGYDGQGSAEAEFEIGGVQVLSRSSLVNIGKNVANFIGVADLKALAQTQKGSLRMNLMGEAQAFLNAETGEWEMKLVKKERRDFKFRISGQSLLQTFLNSESGGVDQLILDGIFGGITSQLLPPALATAFSALPLQEADTKITVDLSGRMTERGGPLKVSTKGEVTFSVQPAKLFKYWTDNFNLEEMAVKKVDEFLARDDVQEAWKNDRKAFADNLRRYGFGLLLNNLKARNAATPSNSPKSVEDAEESSKLDILEAVMEGGNLEALRPFLYEAAKGAASLLLRIFEPYMVASTNGEAGLFDGLKMQTDVWANYGTPDARIRAGATIDRGEEKKTIAQFPGKLMAITGLDKVLALPRANQTTSQVEFDVEFKGTSFKVKRTQLKDFRLNTGGGVDTDGKEIPKRVFKMNGKASDVSLTIPKSWDQGLDLTCSNAGMEVTPAGVAVELKEGFAFTGPLFDADTQEPPKVVGSDHIRRGNPATIDGPLKIKAEDQDFLPPWQYADALNVDDYAPFWKAGVNAGIFGSDSQLKTEITFSGSADIGLLDMLKGIMAKRDALDHGYPFGVAKVMRRTSGSYSQANDENVDVLAVVTCGQILLLSPSVLRGSDPWERMDFNPSKGQLELDISNYHSMPEVTDGGRCISLTSSGQPGWTERGRFNVGTYTASEKICGDEASLKRIMDPLRLQIERFKDSRAASWNYGTHDVTKDAQFILGGGRETAPLLQFLRNKLK